MNITLEWGRFGWDYVIEADNGESLLIQTDYDYPGVARTFGWAGEDDDIEGAQNYLDENMGASTEDPGYFS